MSVDTRNKRSSAIGAFSAPRLIMPQPFGTIDANARIILGYSYRGISAAAPGGGGATPWLYRRHTRTIDARNV